MKTKLVYLLQICRGIVPVCSLAGDFILVSSHGLRSIEFVGLLSMSLTPLTHSVLSRLFHKTAWALLDVWLPVTEFVPSAARWILSADSYVDIPVCKHGTISFIRLGISFSTWNGSQVEAVIGWLFSYCLLHLYHWASCRQDKIGFETFCGWADVTLPPLEDMPVYTRWPLVGISDRVIPIDSLLLFHLQISIYSQRCPPSISIPTPSLSLQPLTSVCNVSEHFLYNLKDMWPQCYKKFHLQS